jgi:hypothetical protein
MKRLSLFIGGCVLASAYAGALDAQSQMTQALKPGPDQQKLHYFVGKWNLQSDIKASPFGPAGKNTGTETVELGPNGFSIVFENEIQGPAGVTRNTGILSFDAGAKVYNYYGVDSTGGVSVGRGTATGNTWTWSTESKVQGKTVKGRATITTASPATYSYRFEIADEKGAFMIIEEGRATKM